MYKKPPPKEALEWSFALLFDVALRIGLGKDKPGKSFWTVPELCKKIDLEDAESRVKKWRYGNRIMGEDLDALLPIFCAKEPYCEEWQHVIATCSSYVLKDKGAIANQRKKYFNMQAFPNRGNVSYDLITSLLSVRETFLIDKPSPAINPASNKGKQTSGVLDSLASDIDLRKIFFKNIRFCSANNFDQDQNQCLCDQRTFPYGTKLVHISFESQVLKLDARFELKWFRDRKFYAESTKIWTETFARDLRYAATHIGDGQDTVLEAGRHQVQFVKGQHIIGEASFTIEQ